MKFNSAIIAGVVVMAAAAAPVFAQQHQQQMRVAQQQQQQQMQNDEQMQVEQQACEGDVYALCGQAIPDQNRIEKCLRSKWSRVSHKCRKVMASYGRRHHGRHGRPGQSY